MVLATCTCSGRNPQKGEGAEGSLTCHTGQVRGEPPCHDFLISTSPHTAFSGTVPPASPYGCPLMPLPTLWGDAHPWLPTSIIVTFTSVLLENAPGLAWETSADEKKVAVATWRPSYFQPHSCLLRKGPPAPSFCKKSCPFSTGSSLPDLESRVPSAPCWCSVLLEAVNRC